MENMFCFQCQETAKNVGCTVKGVCGKDAVTSNAMDLLIFTLEGISVVSTALRENQIKFDEKRVNEFVRDGLFATITNANFDETSIKNRITSALALREELKLIAQESNITLPKLDALNWHTTADKYDATARVVSILQERDEDVRSLSQLTIYGLKGMAAYAEHAARLGYTENEIDAFMQKALNDIILKNRTVEELLH